MMYETDPKTLHEGRKMFYETAAEYRSSFINTETNLIYKHLTEDRPCPVCQSKKSNSIFIKNGGQYVKCQNCEMIYLNPVFKDQELRKYYQNNHTSQAESHINESKFYQSIYSHGLNRIEKFVNKGSILDIGCSSGFFLDMAKSRGWKTYGIELNHAEFNIAQQKKHTVWNLPLDEVSFEQNFDAITMWDVFEHIKNGQSFLNQLKQLLHPTGVIFLQIPNADALASRILQERCNMFDGIEHVNLYSPKTLQNIAKQTNFNILDMKTVIDELKVLKKYLNYEDPYWGEFKNAENPEFSFLTGDLIHQFKLGYKIQSVLQPFLVDCQKLTTRV